MSGKKDYIIFGHEKPYWKRKPSRKEVAVGRFAQLWDQYVECPKSELTKDAIQLRKELRELVGV